MEPQEGGGLRAMGPVGLRLGMGAESGQKEAAEQGRVPVAHLGRPSPAMPGALCLSLPRPPCDAEASRQPSESRPGPTSNSPVQRARDSWTACRQRTGGARSRAVLNAGPSCNRWGHTDSWHRQSRLRPGCTGSSYGLLGLPLPKARSQDAGHPQAERVPPAGVSRTCRHTHTHTWPNPGRPPTRQSPAGRARM